MSTFEYYCLNLLLESICLFSYLVFQFLFLSATKQCFKGYRILIGSSLNCGDFTIVYKIAQKGSKNFKNLGEENLGNEPKTIIKTLFDLMVFTSSLRCNSMPPLAPFYQQRSPPEASSFSQPLTIKRLSRHLNRSGLFVCISHYLSAQILNFASEWPCDPQFNN